MTLDDLSPHFVGVVCVPLPNIILPKFHKNPLKYVETVSNFATVNIFSTQFNM